LAQSEPRVQIFLFTLLFVFATSQPYHYQHAERHDKVTTNPERVGPESGLPHVCLKLVNALAEGQDYQHEKVQNHVRNVYLGGIDAL